MGFVETRLAGASPAARRRLAFGVSLLVHAALLVALFARAGGELRAAPSGGGDLGVMQVTLVRTASPPPPAPATGGLRALVAPVDTGAAPVFVDDRAAAGPLAQLMRRLADTAPPVPQTPRDHITPVTPGVPETGPDPTSSAAKGAPGRAAGAAKSGSTGGLWGAVEPCWRAVAPGSRVAVTLEVRLDASSRLAAPPTILRPDGARLDETRLRAEALALNALAQCLPQADLRLAGGFYRLEFRPG